MQANDTAGFGSLNLFRRTLALPPTRFHKHSEQHGLLSEQHTGLHDGQAQGLGGAARRGAPEADDGQRRGGGELAVPRDQGLTTHARCLFSLP